MSGNNMPPTLEKKKKGQKQKQKQQQTVIVNINKRTQSVRGERSIPRNNGIEKPKEQKEQPKTYTSFSFSMPQAQNPIGEYLKVYQKDLFAKIEQAIKTKDSVINSVNEPVAISTQSVKELKRTPTVLETLPQPTTLDNFMKNQEELKKPLIIGEPTPISDVTTLDEPTSISLDEEPPEEKTSQTVETLKKVDEPPNLVKALSSNLPALTEPTSPESTRSTSPIELGAPLTQLTPAPIIEKKKPGRPPLSEEEKAYREVQKTLNRKPVGRPVGSTNLRARLENRFGPEDPVKPAPQRRQSLNLGRPIGTTVQWL